MKRLPPLLTDEEAERFVDEADLSEDDLCGGRMIRFELKKKDRTVSLRLSDDLLQAIKETAATEGIPYQRFMRNGIERTVRDVQRRKEMEKAYSTADCYSHFVNGAHFDSYDVKTPAFLRLSGSFGFSVSSQRRHQCDAALTQ